MNLLQISYGPQSGKSQILIDCLEATYQKLTRSAGISRTLQERTNTGGYTMINCKCITSHLSKTSQGTSVKCSYLPCINLMAPHIIICTSSRHSTSEPVHIPPCRHITPSNPNFFVQRISSFPISGIFVSASIISSNLQAVQKPPMNSITRSKHMQNFKSYPSRDVHSNAVLSFSFFCLNFHCL
jgi:hypothetical protein